MNRSKSKGTRYETRCVDQLRARLGDDRIHRKALAGQKDKGDIGGIFAHGHEGIAECKDAKQQRLGEWMAQTVRERENANVDFAVLLVHEPGNGEARFMRDSAYMQLRDLLIVSGIDYATLWEDSLDLWVRVDVGTLCDLIEGCLG